MRQYKFSLSSFLVRCVSAIGSALAVASCGWHTSDGTATPMDVGRNHVPQISGSPPSTISAGIPYSFQPSASDADGDPLLFQISRLPSWATFNPASGMLTGTPTNANVGQANVIVISVSDGKTTASLAPFALKVQSSPIPPSPGTNLPPVILGTPPGSAPAGQGYVFQPSASDPNGDDLAFSIVNQPSWTTFDPATGRLTGTPALADVGSYSNIVITASDGIATAALSAFSIAVTEIATGSASISWLPPTHNTDGTALTDLAGFRIYYGTSPEALTQTATVSNPGLTRYAIQNLGPATWYFTVRAYASDGTESGPSNVASKTIR